MKCDRCGGAGERTPTLEEDGGIAKWRLKVPCTRCQGTGQIIVRTGRDRCKDCGGLGKTWVPSSGTYPSGMQKRAWGPCPRCSGTGTMEYQYVMPDFS
jgi:DnaJ-class molecular chaperone